MRRQINIFFFLFFPENKIWHFVQIVSNGDNLHEMLDPGLWEKGKKKSSIYRLCKFYPEC